MNTLLDFIHHFLIISIISIILFTIVIAFIYEFILPAIRIKKDLQETINRLKQIKAASKGKISDLEEISREITANDKLSHAWHEYCETLHEQTAPEQYGKEKKIRWRSTTLAETFFTEQSLVDTPLKTAFYKHLPGILTGLGIIGTFSGLIVGLIRFEVSGDADKVRASLNGLIQSVGYSFIVSASAISLAMIFIWIEKSLVTGCYRHVERLCQLIDSLFDTGAGEEYLARLVIASETSALQTQQIKESLVLDLKKVISEITTQQMKASALLNKQLSENIAQTLTDTIRAPIERISLAVDRAGANQGETVNTLLSDLLSNFASQMHDMFGNQIHQMSNLLQQTATTMQSAALQINKLSENTQLTGKDAAEAMVERMSITNNSIESFIGDLGAKVTNIVKSLETQSRHTTEETGALQNQLAQYTISAMSEISTQIKTLATEMRQASEVMHDSVGSLSQTTKESMILFHSGANTLNTAMNGFAKAGQGINNTMQAANDTTEKIQIASSNLVQATNGVKNMMDEYKNMSKIFAAIVSDLKSTIENARKEASMTTQIVSQIQEATEQLGIAENKAGEYLHGLTEVLAQAHAEFAGNIELTLRKSNSRFHEELSRSVSLISGAIQDFGDVLDSVMEKGEIQCSA